MLEGHSSVQGLCSGVRMDSNRKKKKNFTAYVNTLKMKLWTISQDWWFDFLLVELGAHIWRLCPFFKNNRKPLRAKQNYLIPKSGGSELNQTSMICSMFTSFHAWTCGELKDIKLQADSKTLFLFGSSWFANVTWLWHSQVWNHPQNHHKWVGQTICNWEVYWVVLPTIYVYLDSNYSVQSPFDLKAISSILRMLAWSWSRRKARWARLPSSVRPNERARMIWRHHFRCRRSTTLGGEYNTASR